MLSKKRWNQTEGEYEEQAKEKINIIDVTLNKDQFGSGYLTCLDKDGRLQKGQSRKFNGAKGESQ